MDNFSEEESWTPYDIFNVIWSSTCLVPNFAILYVILARRLYSVSNFYFVLFHWSLSNLLYIVTLLYLEVIPDEYLTLKCLEISYFFHDAVPTLFISIVVMFIYNTYIDSRIVCKSTVYLFWIFYVLSGSAIVAAVHMDLTNNEIWLYLSGVTRIVCFAVVTVEAALFHGERTKNRSSTVRFVISALYVASDFAGWITDVFLSRDVYDVVVYEAVSMFFYGNGLINLVMLTVYDVNFKNCYKIMW